METYWVWEYGLFEKNPKRQDSLNPETTLEVVKAADAQATIAALQARVRELEESRDAWRASQECSEKAYMALVNQIPAERFDYDPVNVALLDGAKEQEIIGRKQIADLQAALNAEREKVARLDAMYRQQLGDRDKRIDALAGSAKIWMDKLTQLRGLVRALPVVTGELEVDCGACYYVRALDGKENPVVCGLMTEQATAFAIKALLAYRATLDATTPAPDTSIIGKCEPPSQWDPNAQVRGDIS